MTVKELIIELKKMPQDKIVYWQDFDCDDFGMSSGVTTVRLENFDNLTEFQSQQNEMKLAGEIVVLRG